MVQEKFNIENNVFVALIGYFATAGDVAAALLRLPAHTDSCIVINLQQSLDDFSGLHTVICNAPMVKCRAGMQVGTNPLLFCSLLSFSCLMNFWRETKEDDGMHIALVTHCL